MELEKKKVTFYFICFIIAGFIIFSSYFLIVNEHEVESKIIENEWKIFENSFTTSIDVNKVKKLMFFSLIYNESKLNYLQRNNICNLENKIFEYLMDSHYSNNFTTNKMYMAYYLVLSDEYVNCLTQLQKNELGNIVFLQAKSLNLTNNNFDENLSFSYVYVTAYSLGYTKKLPINEKCMLITNLLSTTKDNVYRNLRLLPLIKLLNFEHSIMPAQNRSFLQVSISPCNLTFLIYSPETLNCASILNGYPKIYTVLDVYKLLNIKPPEEIANCVKNFTDVEHSENPTLEELAMNIHTEYLLNPGA